MVSFSLFSRQFSNTRFIPWVVFLLSLSHCATNITFLIRDRRFGAATKSHERNTMWRENQDVLFALPAAHRDGNSQKGRRERV
jgi:hypothetical protein